ncbi:MAG: DUF2169 domain-containing protein [Thioploca sp.]|nr:DUF2169 domain-containing protein [Thioploca sp.]
MLFRNFTPFPPLQFESRDEQRRDFGVVVLRGTFEIRNYQTLFLLQEQEPLIMADVYHGEPGKSSLWKEGNLAPYKPKTDIHINAIAHAPEGKPLPQWNVAVKVGKIQKQLLVMGPRYWYQERGWRLTEPQPCLQVPIRYEQAYGGIYQQAVYQENPVGLGYIPSKTVEMTTSTPLPAPQIMSPDEPITEWGKIYKPEGLGPLAPAWQPRVAYAGTFNAVWEKTRWPDLPEDFRFDFYNSAHPDLIYPGFVEGDETIELRNLSATERLQFKLPGFTLGLLVRWEDGEIAPMPVRLDTIHIEVPEMRVYLTWRGIFPVEEAIRVLEVRMRRTGEVEDGR